MEELLNNINEKTKIIIKGSEYTVETKTWYSIEEDSEVTYVKCELSNNRVLVIIPDDELIYIGQVVENMKYERISEDKIKYQNQTYVKTGEGHQFITKIEFGDKDKVEGKCTFEDYESGNNVISLGVLTEKNNRRADVYSDIINIEDIEI